MIQTFREVNKSGSHPFQVNNGPFQLLWYFNLIIYISKNPVPVCLGNKCQYFQHTETYIFCDYHDLQQNISMSTKKCVRGYLALFCFHYYISYHGTFCNHCPRRLRLIDITQDNFSLSFPALLLTSHSRLGHVVEEMPLSRYLGVFKLELLWGSCYRENVVRIPTVGFNYFYGYFTYK